MTRKLLTFALLLSFSIMATAQSGEDEQPEGKEIQYNKFKREIGLDFQFLDRNLRLSSVGSNLIFKKHIGEQRFVSLNEKKALRIQFGGYVDSPIGKQDTLERFASLTNINYSEAKDISLRALVGIEWQKQLKRIQLFYGFDSGIIYSESVDPYSATFLVSTGEIVGYVTYGQSSLTIPLYGFMGVKYFIHPRVSLSIESSLNLGISWLSFKRTNYDTTFDQINISSEGKRREINLRTDYLRYLNVSFHF